MRKNPKIKRTLFQALGCILAILIGGCSGVDVDSMSSQSADGSQEPAAKLRFADDNGKPVNWWQDLFGDRESFHKRIRRLRHYEFQAKQVEKLVGVLQAKIVQLEGELGTTKKELEMLKGERARTLASIAKKGDLFEQGVFEYRNKNYAKAIQQLDAFLSVSMNDKQRAPKALLWKGLSHARLNQWVHYKQTLKRLKKNFPESEEAKVSETES